MSLSGGEEMGGDEQKLRGKRLIFFVMETESWRGLENQTRERRRRK